MSNNEKRRIVTYDELAGHNTATDCWLAIDGLVYDVTDFLESHPGGSMNLQTAGGVEASGIFHSLHPSWVASKALPKRTVVGQLEEHKPTLPWPKFTQDDAFSVELRERIEREFQIRGYAKRGGVRVWAEVFFILAAFVFFFFYMPITRTLEVGFVNISWPEYLLYLTAAGWFGAQIGMNIMHGSNHGAVTTNKLLRFLMDHSLEVIGGGAARWKVSHNVGHHQWTNTPNDPDQNFQPFLRLHPDNEQLDHYRYQHLYLPILMCINFAAWEFRDSIFLFKTRNRWTSHVVWAHIVGSLIHKFLMYGVFVYVFGSVFSGLLHGLICKILASVPLVMLFLVSHNNHELKSLTQEDLKAGKPESWCGWQVQTSQNWCAGQWWANYVSGGLNHQIEHHLFPSIHHCHYPWMAPIVQEVCKKHGIPYSNYSTFGDCFLTLITTLKFYGVVGAISAAAL